MNIRDLKYLLAYLLPLVAALNLIYPQMSPWSVVILAFGIVPLLEWLLPASKDNFEEPIERQKAGMRLFDYLLWLNVPLIFGVLYGYFRLVASDDALSPAYLAGLTLSAGIVLGANGINVAHELGHRAKVWEQRLAQLLLMPSLYMHFFIEHNRGHHKHVATDRDPASARRGEWVYAFWIRSIAGGWRSAWQLERRRLTQAGLPFWSARNAMLRYLLIQAAWLGAVYAFFGAKALLGAVAVALISVLLLETINYIEHYGLRRNLLDNGRYEPVSPRHSWNSNHEVGRILLYELTRHSDHHYKSSRKYQILRHIDESPQLPFGYPAAMLAALVPPLWFWIMDKRMG
ncbi:MAG: alkane 1-monooxygenase [Saprospiraceae bacterium]